MPGTDTSTPGVMASNAAATGELCIDHAGQVVGDGFSVQANMMASPDVWPAMAERFRASDGPLAHLLLDALVAGEEAGGDARGRMSAAILVVEARSEAIKDLLAAVDVARNQPGVSTIAMSWGGSEGANNVKMDAHFTTPAGHAGITFLTASGDEGPKGGAEWPSASTRVVSVGGTNLAVASDGTADLEAVYDEALAALRG